MRVCKLKNTVGRLRNFLGLFRVEPNPLGEMRLIDRNLSSVVINAMGTTHRLGVRTQSKGRSMFVPELVRLELTIRQ